MFSSLEEMIRYATIPNMWIPASNVTGWYGFGSSMAGKSVLRWSGRGVWKDLKGGKPGELLNTHQKLTSAKEDLGHQVDRVTHYVGDSQLLPQIPSHQSVGSDTKWQQFCIWAW